MGSLSEVSNRCLLVQWSTLLPRASQSLFWLPFIGAAQWPKQGVNQHGYCFRDVEQDTLAKRGGKGAALEDILGAFQGEQVFSVK